MRAPSNIVAAGRLASVDVDFSPAKYNRPLAYRTVDDVAIGESVTVPAPDWFARRFGIDTLPGVVVGPSNYMGKVRDLIAPDDLTPDDDPMVITQNELINALLSLSPLLDDIEKLTSKHSARVAELIFERVEYLRLKDGS